LNLCRQRKTCRAFGRSPAGRKLSSARRSRDFGISRGAYLAAFGGEMRPNYFKNSPPKLSTADLVEKC